MSTAIVYPNLEEFASCFGDKPCLWISRRIGACRAECCPVIEQLGEQYQGRAEVAKVKTNIRSLLPATGYSQFPPMIFDKGSSRRL